MGKIVVLASGEDADAVNTALEGAGLDFEVVDPTPGNLLHIVIGMVGDDEGSENKEKKEKKEPAEAPTEEPEVPVEEPAAEEPAEELPEGFVNVTVNGEIISAARVNSPSTYLCVKDLASGARCTYSLNESMFSFWPADQVKPQQRVLIEHGQCKTSVEIDLRKASSTYLAIGDDLASILK